MRFRQFFYIHFRRGTVRIRTGIQVDIVGAGQLAVHFYAVVTGKLVIHLAFQGSFQSSGIGFRRQIHLTLVAAAEGDIAAFFKFSLLLQFCAFADGNRIRRSNLIIAVGIDIFCHAAAFAFYLVVDIHIGVGVVNLTFSSSHLSVIANDHIGFAGHNLFRFDIRRNLNHAAHVHVVVPAFPVISAGDDLVGRQHIALACVQLRSLIQFGFAIHLHIVVGVGPGNA